jgi:aspartyl-tRNA(Asn)/glutamyl-tRNA(Gln) amidotransferase subunit B
MGNAKDIVKPVIGLEIHVELATATKMFCRCRNRFGDPPNTNVCPVCIGMPGVLPVMNRRAVELAMKVGLALNCAVADLTKWDRKSYYYPDLPKNYQISQYDLPLSVNGCLETPLGDGSTKRVRILRAHLEEDAGKNIHDHPAHTGVDLNRAGVPLLEIVSEPDMNTVEEVMSFARAMHRLVRWLGASEANMQMGHMRFEPNINLHITRGQQTFKTPIVEVKNLNSFRALERTVEYEIQRQYDAWLENPEGYSLEKLGKQNRGYDDAREQTVFQREKEEAHDYRYFPEPDLVPVVVDEAWRESIQATIGELPLARRKRYMESYNLTFKEADALTQEAGSGDLLDAAVAAGASPKRVANILLGQCAAIANRDDLTIFEAWSRKRPGKTLPELAAPLTRVCEMIEIGTITPTASANVVALVIETGEDPDTIVDRKGWRAVKDSGTIEAWVEAAIAANPQAVADVKEGGKKQKKAFGFLMGQVMQMSRGTAQPAEVQRLLQGKLDL